MKSKILITLMLALSLMLTGCSQLSDIVGGNSTSSQSSGTEWTCAECNTTNSSTFCSNCGVKKPSANTASGEESWDCTCGTSNTGKFCKNCGSKKSDLNIGNTGNTGNQGGNTGGNTGGNSSGNTGGGFGDVGFQTTTSNSTTSTPSESTSGPSGITTVGDDITGYIDLTATNYDLVWVNFQELEPVTNEHLVSFKQASDFTQSVIVTMAAYHTLTVEDIASSIYLSCQCNGGVDVTGATVRFAGYDAKQVYCFYPDSKKFLVTWMFNTDYDNYTHYVAVEFTEKYSDIVNMCESFSYKGAKPSGGGTVGGSLDAPITGTPSTVSATLNRPARIGEWVKVVKYSATTSKNEVCYIRITNNVRGAAAQRVVDSYNASDSYGYFEELSDDDLEWGAFEYEIYYPKDYPAQSWGISVPDTSNFSICDGDDDGPIDNYIGLSSVSDISESFDVDCYPGDTFKGQAVYAMSKGYDYYLVKYEIFQECTVYFDVG